VEGTVIADEGHHVANNGAELRISAGKKKHGILRPA
jgi:tyrosyl-tRNA synthetase